MYRLSWLRYPLALLSLFILGAAAAAQTAPSDLFAGLVWRNIGPFRGGRVSAVSGVIGQPGVFYMGLPMGGVWKSTSAGTTWFPIFDGIKDASSVGAIAVAPSDPNVVYVGMGDMISGGGKTWQQLGLEKTEHIPSSLVDPHDPSLVRGAAQGNINAKTADRGLYR